MKGQKQSKVDKLQKQMAAAVNILQQLINESENLKTMVFGQQEIIKQLDGYEQAIEKLKKKVSTEPSKGAETKTN